MLRLAVCCSMPQRAARPTITVRRYQPQVDHAAVVDICRNVYGGTDILPKVINEQAEEPETSVLVAENGHGVVDALVCCQHRGDSTWVWGARTREEARGQGLAGALLDHVELQARSSPAVAWLLSTTIPENGTMLRLFTRLGLSIQCDIDVWPRASSTAKATRLLQQDGQDLGGPAWNPLQQLGLDSVRLAPPILSILPAEAAEALRSAAASAQLLQWEACSSVSQLLSLHQQLRQHRAAAAPGSLPSQLQLPATVVGHSTAEASEAAAAAAAAGFGNGSGRQVSSAGEEVYAEFDSTSGAFAWLPLDYQLLPLASEQAQQAVEEGRVWILPPAPEDAAAEACSPNTSLHAGMLAISYCCHRQRWFAGIVAGSEAALCSAVIKALELQPRCLQFYVDRCDRSSRPGWMDAEEGGEGPRSYLVCHKLLRR